MERSNLGPPFLSNEGYKQNHLIIRQRSLWGTECVFEEGPALYVEAANEMIPFNNTHFFLARFPPPDSVAKLGRKGIKWSTLHSKPVKVNSEHHFFKKKKKKTGADAFLLLSSWQPSSISIPISVSTSPTLRKSLFQCRPQMYAQGIWEQTEPRR